MLHLVVCADFQRLGGLRGINQSSAANRQAKEIETVGLVRQEGQST